MTDLPAHACAVCARVLDLRENDDGTYEWQHAFQDMVTENHLPVPVLASEIQTRGRCDFCSAENPQWVLPARAFDYAGLLPDTGSGGDWAACDECAALLRTNSWNAVLRRALVKLPDASPEVIRRLGAMHRRLRRNVTGPLRPFRGWKQDG